MAGLRAHRQVLLCLASGVPVAVPRYPIAVPGSSTRQSGAFTTRNAATRHSEMPRPRKSPSLHAIEGTTPDYVWGLTDESTPGRPKVPKGLSRDAKKAFKRLCDQLEQRRALTAGDGELLRLAAVLIDRHQRATDKCQGNEIIEYFRDVGDGKQVPVMGENPWLKIAQQSERTLTSILDRLGLTPRERGRITPTKDKAENGEEQYAEQMFAPKPTQPETFDDLPPLENIGT